MNEDVSKSENENKVFIFLCQNNFKDLIHQTISLDFLQNIISLQSQKIMFLIGCVTVSFCSYLLNYFDSCQQTPEEFLKDFWSEFSKMKNYDPNLSEQNETCDKFLFKTKLNEILNHQIKDINQEGKENFLSLNINILISLFVSEIYKNHFQKRSKTDWVIYDSDRSQSLCWSNFKN